MLCSNAKLPLTTCCNHNPPILLSNLKDLEGQQELPTNRLVAAVAQDCNTRDAHGRAVGFDRGTSAMRVPSDEAPAEIRQGAFPSQVEDAISANNDDAQIDVDDDFWDRENTGIEFHGHAEAVRGRTQHRIFCWHSWALLMARASTTRSRSATVRWASTSCRRCIHHRASQPISAEVASSPKTGAGPDGD